MDQKNRCPPISYYEWLDIIKALKVYAYIQELNMQYAHAAHYKGLSSYLTKFFGGFNHEE